MNSRRNGPQAQRFADRRKREDDAPRLAAEVPGLVTLQFDVEDRAGVCGGTKYTRRIMVDHAPALFLVPCGDPRCSGEEHDLTHEMMRALHSQRTSFEGDDECRGSVGPGSCTRVLKFEAVATYRN
jgi:hypothetical protein